jgi:glycine/D-amino acid oxidase-like deaminating enzyme
MTRIAWSATCPCPCTHFGAPDLRITPSHHWAGAFGESPTGLPIIDRGAGLRRCYNVTGFGGYGITHSVIASEVIAHAIDGKPDRDRDLFRAPASRRRGLPVAR